MPVKDTFKRTIPVRVLSRLLIILKDFYIDFKIQKRIIGYRRIKSIDPAAGISNWQSTTYNAVDDIFFKYKYVQVNEEDIIVDVGCGDGKLFNFFLYKGFKNKLIGYEINKREGISTKRGLLKYKNVEIILGDIFEKFPNEATLFYLFNPFGENLIMKFIEALKKIYPFRPTVVYNYPIFVHLFDPGIFNISIIQLHQYKFGIDHIAIIKFKD